MILVIPSRNSTTKRSSNQEVVLKVWKEGFTINDGELHSIDQPENREFLLTVARGSVMFYIKLYKICCKDSIAIL